MQALTGSGTSCISSRLKCAFAFPILAPPLALGWRSSSSTSKNAEKKSDFSKIYKNLCRFPKTERVNSRLIPYNHRPTTTPILGCFWNVSLFSEFSVQKSCFFVPFFCQFEEKSLFSYLTSHLMEEPEPMSHRAFGDVSLGPHPDYPRDRSLGPSCYTEIQKFRDGSKMTNFSL
jgi:hypothetical protein